MCHINMLKAYIIINRVKPQPDPVDPLPIAAFNLSHVYSPELDGLWSKKAIASCGTPICLI